MRDKFNKVIVGLALESELYNERFNRALFRLYSNPNLYEIRALHDRLIASDNHFDREVAFWLEPALEQIPVKIDSIELFARLHIMENGLFNLLRQVNPSLLRDLNDWLNYIINAGHSVEEESWIHAKILMSQALQSSKAESIERIKSDPRLRIVIEVLQMETLRCFEQVRRFPSRVELLEERLDAILEVQGILIELMRKYYLERVDNEAKELIRYPIQKLDAALRYLMQSDTKIEAANEETTLASEHLEWQMNSVSDPKTLEWAKAVHGRVKMLSAQFSSKPDSNK